MPSIRSILVTRSWIRYSKWWAKPCIYRYRKSCQDFLIAIIALRLLRSLFLIVIIALRSLRSSPKLPYSNYTKPVRQYSITGVYYRTTIVLILAPPFRFLVPRNHLSFMPPLRNYRSSNLSVRRRELARKLIEVAIRPYSLYIKGNK